MKDEAAIRERESAPEETSSDVQYSDDTLQLISEQTKAMKALAKNMAEAMAKWPEMAKERKKAEDADRQRAIDGRHPDSPVLSFREGKLLPKREDLRAEIEKLNDACVATHLYKSAAEREYDTRRDENGVPLGVKGLKAYQDLQTLLEKAAGDFWQTGGTNAGSEWVPTGFLREVIELKRLNTNVPGLFQQITIPQGVGTLNVPVKTTKASWVVVPENTGASFTWPQGANATITNAGTDVMALKGIKHKGVSGLSREEQEDAIVAVVQVAREELAMSALESLESAIINGQPAGSGDTTLDGVNGPAPADKYSVAAGRGGLRYHGTSSNKTPNLHDAGGNALTLADIEAGRVLMGIHGVRPSDMALIVTPASYIDLITETSTPIKTVDTFGPGRATLVSGQLASVYGHPVLVSEHIPTNLATTGRAHPATGTTTVAIMVDRTRWRRGLKRNIEIRQIDVVGDDALILVGFVRSCINSAKPDANKHVAIIHNVLR